MAYMPELNQAAINRQQIADIKRRYLMGEISRETAKAEAQPVIQTINKRGAAIAQKWRKIHTPLTFTSLIR